MTYSAAYKAELLKAIESLELDRVEQAVEWFREARAQDRRIFVCGNGGSASTASHFACDMGRDGGKLGPLAQLNIQAREPHMGRIEDVHMITCHMIAYRFMEEDGGGSC